MRLTYAQRRFRKAKRWTIASVMFSVLTTVLLFAGAAFADAGQSFYCAACWAVMPFALGAAFACIIFATD